jgi:hypothetical protein
MKLSNLTKRTPPPQKNAYEKLLSCFHLELIKFV